MRPTFLLAMLLAGCAGSAIVSDVTAPTPEAGAAKAAAPTGTVTASPDASSESPTLLGAADAGTAAPVEPLDPTVDAGVGDEPSPPDGSGITDSCAPYLLDIGIPFDPCSPKGPKPRD